MAKREDNLRPIKKGELSKDEAKKRGSKGGKKSAKVRKEKKLLKDTIEMLMKSKPTPEMVTMCADAFGFNPSDLQEIVTCGLIKKAIAGDPKAFEVLRDTLGQKPKEVVEAVNKNIEIKDEKLIKSVFDKLKEI